MFAHYVVALGCYDALAYVQIQLQDGNLRPHDQQLGVQRPKRFAEAFACCTLLITSGEKVGTQITT